MIKDAPESLRTACERTAAGLRCRSGTLGDRMNRRIETNPEMSATGPALSSLTSLFRGANARTDLSTLELLPNRSNSAVAASSIFENRFREHDTGVLHREVAPEQTLRKRVPRTSRTHRRARAG